MPAAINDAVRLLRMDEQGSGPLTHCEVWLLRSDSIITGNPSQTGSRQVYAVETITGDLGEGPFLQINLSNEHQGERSQEYLRESRLRLHSSVQHPIPAEWIIEPLCGFLAEVQAASAGMMNSKDRTFEELKRKFSSI